MQNNTCSTCVYYLGRSSLLVEDFEKTGACCFGDQLVDVNYTDVCDNHKNYLAVAGINPSKIKQSVNQRKEELVKAIKESDEYKEVQKTKVLSKAFEALKAQDEESFLQAAKEYYLILKDGDIDEQV